MPNPLKRIQILLSENRFKAFAFSLIFGINVIFIYYILQWIIPDALNLYHEIVTVLFTVLSVLVLFPAREMLLKNLLKRTDYDYIFGSDFHHLDFIAQHFTMDSIVYEVFPELMTWLRVKSARLAILDSNRRNFIYYTYRNNVVQESKQLYFQLSDDIKTALRLKHGNCFIEDPTLPEEIKTILERLRSTAIIPFYYRSRLLGFLLLGEPIRNKYADRGLEMFAGKAAVSIQNKILSHKIIDSDPYDREIVTADKIRKLLQTIHLPEIPGYKVENIKTDRTPCTVDFFNLSPNKWILVILSTPKLNSAAGLILAGMLAKVYSFMNKEQNPVLHRINAYIRKDKDLEKFEYPLDVLLAEIDTTKSSITVMIDGKNYKIYNPTNPSSGLITLVGWRNFVDLEKNKSIQIDYGPYSLLQMTRLK